jgi:peptidoglycan/LPS O-acetylase OafA/YrhL
MEGGRLDALDGLRGLAALAVVVLHAWLYTTRDSSDLSQPVDAVLHELRLGLVLFFVLSGFLLFRPWLSPDPKGRPFGLRVRRYAVRRAARILPAYYAALLGALAILLAVGDHGHLPPARLLPLFFVFGQNYSPATLGTIDPPMWTLAVEASFYVVLPVLALIVRGLGPGRPSQAILPLWLLVVGLAFNGVVAGVHLPSPVFAAMLPAVIPYFACGMLAAVLLPRRAIGRLPAAGLIVAGLALVVYDGWWHTQVFAVEGRVFRDLPAAAGFAAIVVATAAAKRPGPLASRPLRSLGEVSYGLYLWHMPLIIAIRAVGLWPSETTFAIAVLVPVSLAVAAASWRFVERPMIRAARRIEPAAQREPRGRALSAPRSI